MCGTLYGGREHRSYATCRIEPKMRQMGVCANCAYYSMDDNEGCARRMLGGRALQRKPEISVMYFATLTYAMTVAGQCMHYLSVFLCNNWAIGIVDETICRM